MIKRKRQDFYKKIAIFFGLFCAVIFIIVFIKNLKKNNGIDWEAVKNFRIPSDALIELKNSSEKYETDFSKMIVCFMIENDFFKTEKDYKINEFIMDYNNISKKYYGSEVEEYQRIIKSIYDEIKVFPVKNDSSNNTYSKNAQYIYGDSFGAERTYGGKRKHLGCDIMDRDNIKGRFQIVSMTDGVIEKMGWNEKGGWRVGIKSPNGNYYYYAHLDKYNENIYEGQKINAGDIIGVMGDSGYGKEGTTGNFEVHLHVGIGINGDEDWINPYPFLRLIEESK